MMRTKLRKLIHLRNILQTSSSSVNLCLQSENFLLWCLNIRKSIGNLDAEKNSNTNFSFISVFTRTSVFQLVGKGLQTNSQLKGTVQAKQNNLYYSFDSDENLHAYVKSKKKWGNRQELFPFSS